MCGIQDLNWRSGAMVLQYHTPRALGPIPCTLHDVPCCHEGNPHQK